MLYQGRLALLKRHESKLRRWWDAMHGRARLLEKQSTAAVGTWHIKDGAVALAKRFNLNIVAFTLLGKEPDKRRGLLLKKEDSTAKINAQWDLLVKEFNDPDSVLLFHLTNHYALVFGVRDYIDPETKGHHRHILTAKANQEPKIWIPWLECRTIMLNWSGYCMVSLRRTSS